MQQKAQGRNCIDIKLPWCVTSALRVVATDREAGLRQFGGAGGWCSGGDERGKGKSERWAAQKRKSSKNSLPDKLPLPTAAVTPGRVFPDPVEKQYPGTDGTTFVQGAAAEPSQRYFWGRNQWTKKKLAPRHPHQPQYSNTM